MQKRDVAVEDLEPLAEDYDMWLQLLSHGLATVVPRVLVARHDLPTGAGSVRAVEVKACVDRLRARVLDGLRLPAGPDDVRLLSLLTEPFVADAIGASWSALIDRVDAFVRANNACHRYPTRMFESVAYGKLFRALRAGSTSDLAPMSTRSDVSHAASLGRRWLVRRTVEQCLPEQLAAWWL
jgi:hypothetical protein